MGFDVKAAPMDATSMTISHKRLFIVRLLALLGLVLLVGFSPIAHVLKQFIGSESRYSGWEARDLVYEKMRAGDRLYFSTDRFLPPFLDLVAENYAGKPGIKTYWIFPYLVIGQDQEARTIKDFVCLVRQWQGGSIVWGLSKEYLFDMDRTKMRFGINVGFWRRYQIEFAYSEIMYEFYDGLFARGRIKRITRLADNDAGSADKLLYESDGVSNGCS